MKQQQIKCVIFDCEGTLVDSEKLCCQALVSVFNRFGGTLSMDDALMHFDGGKLADILSATRDRLGLNVDVDTLEPLYREETSMLFKDQLKSTPNAVLVLDKLKDLGVEVCVVSNSPRSKLEHKLELTGLTDYFKRAMFSAFEANSWKPDPDLIQYAAMSMGFRTKECLFVDDTSKGVEAGVSANIRTLHYKPNHHSPELKYEGVSEISDLIEVLKYFKSAYQIEYII